MKKQLLNCWKITTNILIIATIIILSSCGNTNEEEKMEREIDPLDYKDDLEAVNKELNQKEAEDINDYIQRYGWKMQETGSGLRYYIYQETNLEGKKVEKAKIITVKFNVNLLNGVKCYNSEEDGNKEFILGRSTEISGLEEGLLLMKEGDKAKLIVPSHLAYGLLGDQEKIPMRATLIYDVEVLKVRELE